MWTKTCVRSVFVATVLAAASTASANSQFYAKVEPSLPSSMSTALLETLTYPGLIYRLGCLQKCNERQCCCLACVNDSACHLYDSRIARDWSSSDDAGALSFDACFTAWGAGRRQVVPVATSASSESQGSEASKALNGLANGQCFASDPEAGSWWMADLGESKPVSEVRIRTALESAGTAAPTLTAARLGNSAEPWGNAPFGEPQRAAEAVFRPARLIGGRFLSLHSLVADAALTICQVEITEDRLPYGSCHDLLLSGYRASGPYTLNPFDCCSDRAVTAYCDMETDGGGWTVVQRRRDVLPREDFYRTWEEYVEGFGNVSSGEFWFGLDAIHALTAMGPTELRIDLADFEGESRIAEYSSFSVGDRDDFYRLTVAGYSGTAGDALSPHNGKRFTTIDRDFDDNAGNCAQMYKGAWWHHNCHTTNLNGRYLAGSTSYFGQGVTWAIWRGNKYSLKNASMMIRPAA